VFKHSTTCPISASARDRVEDYFGDAGADVPEVVMVKVIESRNVSNTIASELDVMHQSPQLILVKNGEAAWDTSHHMINADSINEALAG
jgi:bacillithiol system protein YtxJ